MRQHKDVLDYERQGSKCGWRQIRTTGRDITEDIPTRFYVQDERYAAGAGMRRSGVCQSRTTFNYERYTAGAGMRRSGASQYCTALSAGAACVNPAQHSIMNGYVQDVRYIAGEHMDVRRDCVRFAQRSKTNGTSRAQERAAGNRPRIRPGPPRNQLDRLPDPVHKKMSLESPSHIRTFK